MRLIRLAFPLLLGFLLSLLVKLSHTKGCPTPSFVLHISESAMGVCCENLLWQFAVGICRMNLLWLFAMRICQRNLPWLVVVIICRGYLPWVFCIRKRILFWICDQILLIWKQAFFICEQKVLTCEIFFINSVSFCYCRGSYGLPYITTITMHNACFSFIQACL